MIWWLLSQQIQWNLNILELSKASALCCPNLVEADTDHFDPPRGSLLEGQGCLLYKVRVALYRCVDLETLSKYIRIMRIV